jgi:hypothetical protein
MPPPTKSAGLSLYDQTVRAVRKWARDRYYGQMKWGGIYLMSATKRGARGHAGEVVNVELRAGPPAVYVQPLVKCTNKWERGGWARLASWQVTFRLTDPDMFTKLEAYLDQKGCHRRPAAE